MKNINSRLAQLAAVGAMLVLFGAGCTTTTKKTTAAPDMGVWKTSDRGQTWVLKKALVDGPKVTAGMAEIGVQVLAADPQDRSAIYVGTQDSGLIYSLNGGDSWQYAENLDALDIKGVAVDPKNKCTVYALSANKIFKTKNCGRDWGVTFFDPRTDRTFTQIVPDWFNPTFLYAGNNDGDIYKSADEGVSWQAVKRVNAGVTSMFVSPQDSRVVYVGTDGDGIWKSLDSGVTWVQIRKEFGDIGNARLVIKLVPDPTDANRIYNVYKGGIAKTEDQGNTWTALNLVTDIGENSITDLSIDPNNPKRLVYTGPTALVFSADGGATWEAKKLPTTNKGNVLLTDVKDGNVVYLGIIPTKKKK